MTILDFEERLVRLEAKVFQPCVDGEPLAVVRERDRILSVLTAFGFNAAADAVVANSPGATRGKPYGGIEQPLPARDGARIVELAQLLGLDEGAGLDQITTMVKEYLQSLKFFSQEYVFLSNWAREAVGKADQLIREYKVHYKGAGNADGG